MPAPRKHGEKMRIPRCLQGRDETSAFANTAAEDVCELRVGLLQAPLPAAWIDRVVNELLAPPAPPVARAAGSRKRTPKGPSCGECFFRANGLCALAGDLPCATFRPDHPEGLRPPRQLRFTFRQPGRTTAAWAFPSAAEQAALHQ
jgi:hypothetical protein